MSGRVLDLPSLATTYGERRAGQLHMVRTVWRAPRWYWLNAIRRSNDEAIFAGRLPVPAARLSLMTAAANWPSTLAAGKGVKFAVVDPRTRYRSSTWHIMTARNVDQIFLQELATGPAWKVSHHNEPSWTSGQPAWRIAMTQQEAARRNSGRVVIDEWVPKTPDRGWIEGVGVLIPFAHLRPSSVQPPRLVVEVPSSPVCSGYSVRLFLEDPGATGIAFPPGRPIAVIERCTGGRVYVLATPVTLDRRQFDAFDLMRREAQADRSDELTYPSDRFVGGLNLRGQRCLVDLTLN